MLIDIDKILDEARVLGCSDLHFTFGMAPVVRLNGALRKLSSYDIMDEEAISDIAHRICPDELKDRLNKHLDCDFSYVTKRGYRHRVNVFRQNSNY